LKLILSIILLLLIIPYLEAQPANSTDCLQYVNPFFGTDKYTGPSKWGGYGGTYPGAVVPWGMVQISPETRKDGHPRGYYYSDDKIYYFSLFHHLSGYPDGSKGIFRIMPFVRNSTSERYENGSHFSHDKEEASPGYYRVLLNDLNIETEFTTTVRAGFCRISYNQDKPIILHLYDVNNYVLENDNTLSGNYQSLSFVMRFNTKVESVSETEQGLNVILLKSRDIDEVNLLKFSFSRVDTEGALKNLNTEIPHWNFDAIKEQAKELWCKQLRKIEISGGSENQKTIFYTALYHSFLLPYVVSDVDGKYRGSDGQIHIAKDYNYYTVFSPWDTFRTLHPLLCLIAPSVQRDMIRSLLNIYEQKGRLPTGPMTGNHAIPIIVDSYFKNIRDFDVSKAYDAMKKSLMQAPYAHADMQEYVESGYVPAENPESVTRTLEYAFDDWALAKIAKNLGEDEDHKLLLDRANNYRNVYNPGERFMLPRCRDLSWAAMGGYAEGDKWNYSLFVPHNIRDLINLMGGDQAFSERLEQTFSKQHYLHDNEPPLHYAYLFPFAGKPWKTQQWSREFMTNCYQAEPGGIPGNDDLGAMSSWFVFSAMGLYPLCPGNPWYIIGSPLFEKVTLNLENGRRFEIMAQDGSQKNKYIQSASLNNIAYAKSWLEHSILETGGNLILNMSAEPNTSWATDPQARPPSVTMERPDFIVDDFQFSRTSVSTHQPVTVSALVQNEGAAGTFYQMLYVDGKIVDTTNVLIQSNEIKDVVQKFRLYSPGDHSVGINKLNSKTLTVFPERKTPDDSFKMSDLKFSPLGKTGEPLDISFKVQNISSFSDTTSINICLNDSSAARIETVLNPGEVKKIHSVLTIENPGMYQVRVDTLDPQILKVYQDPLESTMLHLDFNEGQGEISQDYSGFDNEVLLMGGAEWVSGKFGKAVKPGAEGYVEIPLNPGLEITQSSLTMMTWLFPTSEDNSSSGNNVYADFFSRGDYYVLKLQDKNTLSFIAGGWGNGQIYAKVPEDWNGNWHHVAGVFDGKEIKLYIDGVFCESQEFIGQIEYTPFPWNLGRNSEYIKGRNFMGIIDEARIYREALSVEEIKRAMAPDQSTR